MARTIGAGRGRAAAAGAGRLVERVDRHARVPFCINPLRSGPRCSRRPPPAFAPEVDGGVVYLAVIAVWVIVGACWFREPGGPGFSPLAAGVALAASALVVGRLGLGKAGCFGVLLVLAAAAQLMMARPQRIPAARSIEGQGGVPAGDAARRSPLEPTVGPAR